MLTVIRRAGSARPDAISAARTRSRASETALSGKPTTLNAGSPGATCTCTSTARASKPPDPQGDTGCTLPVPRLVLRFRRSHHIAAHLVANVGIKGALDL